MASEIDSTITLITVRSVKGQFTAMIGAAPEGGYWAICPEIPGANGQGKSIATAKTSVRAAIRLILRDQVQDARRGLPKNVIRTVVEV